MIDLTQFDPLLESRIRVAILAMLINGDDASFTYLREKLGATDGNLARHLRALEDARYVRMRKSFIGRRPHTTYTITETGKAALEKYVAILGKLVYGQERSSFSEVEGG